MFGGDGEHVKYIFIFFNSQNYCDFGYSYQHPDYPKGSQKAGSIFVVLHSSAVFLCFKKCILHVSITQKQYFCVAKQLSASISCLCSEIKFYFFTSGGC